MRAALEHPRIASAIAAALILLALAAAAAGSALRGTEQRDAANSATVRLADARTTGLERQVHAAEVQNAQLRGALRTLQARADRLPRPQRCHSRLTPTTHSKR